MPVTNPPVSVRVTLNERDLLEAAAGRARTTLSDFVRRKALEAAELEVLDRRLVLIPAAEWDKFEAWAARPGAEVPALRALAASRPVWQD